jgi:hypothetical protein
MDDQMSALAVTSEVSALQSFYTSLPDSDI